MSLFRTVKDVKRPGFAGTMIIVVMCIVAATS